MIGKTIGPYQVVAKLGEGGMGEVYRATDSNLKRQVALKVLPDSVAGDAERLARFQREAEVLAALNHPHIAAIYGLERSGSTTALVMELVEGEDLSQRIARGAIPLDEALPIAKQIAEALEAAHEQGIIHRDLKPANIKVRADGTVKVLDFGLAKALEPAAASTPAAMNSPTITTPAMTQAGMILGTAAYMAPEQARGKSVDKRADIWAFGCVVYEMLTGQRAFAGDEMSDVLAAVLRQALDWSVLPAATPSRVRRLLVRCLERDARMRLRDIGEARVEIDKTIAGVGDDAAGSQTTQPATSSGPRRRLAWMVTAAAVLVAAALAVPAVRYLRETPTAAAPETRLEIATPATSDVVSFALSPDGRQIAFVASGDGTSRLWVRPLDTTAAQPLAGTDGASFPFWSPDSRSIAFFADSKLKRLDLSGGAPQTLAPAPAGRGGAWSADGVILFATSNRGPLSRVPAGGGDVVPVTTLGAGQSSHRFPHFLPGGRQFLYYVRGAEETAGIYLGALDATAVTRVTAADTAGAYTPPGPGPAEASSEGGWLLFGRQGTLVARRFDATRGALSGDPVIVADALAIDATLNVGAFSVSATGLVTYRAGGGARNQLTWFDRAGQALGTLGAPDATQLDPTLSPDGRQVAVWRVAQSNTDIWLIDAARTTRFTFDPAADLYPVWSPDGRRLVFSRLVRAGILDLYQKPANGGGAEALLLASPETKAATSWSADGRSLLYSAQSPNTANDVWVLPMAGDPKPWPFLNSTFTEATSAYSRDGQWVAYQSDESGRYEIYVRPFPGPGGQWQVSTAGGKDPRWRPDGQELYYIAPDGRLMAAPIASSGTALQPGLPTALFQPRIALGGTPNISARQQYDVAPDGRFLINVNADEGTAAPITVITNWQPEGKK